MIKVILNKDDLTIIKDDIKNQNSIQEIDESNQVAIYLDDKNYEVLERMIKRITTNRKEFLFETPTGWVKIFLRDILYIESFGTEIILHTQSLGDVLVKQPLYQLETLLSPHHVVRIGKSYLVNLSKVTFIRTKLNAKLEIELSNNIKLEVMRSYVKSFKEQLGIGGRK